MTVRLIWAEAHDRVIGADGAIPWRIPGEQAHFKQRTTGATVVMGRATWESLPPRFRPLPGRRNVVLTRDPAWSAEGAETAGSVAEVLRRYDDVWVIGGAGVYAAFLPHADLVVRTEVDLSVAGDTRAPELGGEWRPRPGAWQTPESGPRYRVVELTRRDRGQSVPEIVEPRVTLIAWTHFEAPGDVPWSTDADGGQALAEFAGRACYQSWRKPNPATATNAGYLAHILEVNHLSVFEHGTATFYFTGVSRSFTHELIRHRHFSYSQLSQRYVPERDAAMVEPDVIAQDPDLHKKFVAAAEAGVRAYTELLEGLEARLTDEPDPTLRRKRARQAARAILPNATETRIVVTGNYRAWRHFVQLRATEHADVEIREIAVEVLRQLQRLAPNVFADFTISGLDDGSEVAASPYAPQG